MKRNTKGHHGYIRARKRNLSIMVGILTAGIIGLVLLGYFTLGTKNNWLTIVAILSVLPTANLAVVLFALLPYKGRPKEEYEQVEAIVGEGVLDTELVITSKTDKNMEINYAYFHESGIFCYTINKNMNVKRTEEYLKTMLKNNEVAFDVKVFTDWKAFLRRLRSLEPSSRKTCDEKLLQMEGVFRAISL